MLGRFGLLACLVCAMGCSGSFALGPEVPRPKERKRRVAKTAEPEPEPALRIDGSEESERVRKPLRLSWAKQTQPFNLGVAIAASGQVAVLSSESLALYDARSGGLLARKPVCATFEQAIGFVDDVTLALVCEDSVKLLTLPELSDRGLRALKGKARAVTFGNRRAAIAFESGPVALLDTRSWKQVRQVPVPGPVSAMSLSADDQQLALGFDSGDILIIGPETAPMRFTVKRALGVSTLRFSADGKRLFASSGPLVGVWATDGTELARFATVDGSQGAHWLGPNEIASMGRDGLLLLDAERTSVRSLGGGWTSSASPLSSLAVASAGDRLCSAERDGRVACFSRGRSAAGSVIPTALERLAPGGSILSGRVAAWAGRRLKVSPLPAEPLPEASADVVVYSYVERTVAQVRQARWTEAGRGQVVKLVDGVVHVKLAEPSGATPALAAGEPVRLSW